jgi:hypothetical protein
LHLCVHFCPAFPSSRVPFFPRSLLPAFRSFIWLKLR